MAIDSTTIKIYSRLFLQIVYIAAIHSVVGLLQLLHIIPSYDHKVMAAGMFSNPAFLGCFISIGLTLCVFLTGQMNFPNRKIILPVIIPLLAVNLYASASRTAWISTILSTSLFFFWQQLKIQSHTYKLVLKAAVITIVLVAVTFFLYSKNIASVDGRFLIWKIGWKMFQDNFLLGVGHGNFFVRYGIYQAEYFSEAERPVKEIFSATMNYHPFNDPLKILIEQGFLGGVQLLLLTARILSLSFKFRKHQIVQHSFITIFIIFVFGLSSYVLHFAIFNILLVISLSFIAQMEVRDKKKHITMSKIERFSLIILLVGTGTFSIIKIHAIFLWKKGYENLFTKEKDSLENYSKALRLLSNNGSFLFNYGSEMADLQLHERSHELLQSAKLYSTSVELYIKLGDVQRDLGMLNTAEQSYKIAANLNPKLFLPFEKLLIFYKQTNQIEKSKTLADFIIKKQVKVPSQTIDNIKNLAKQYLNETN